MPRVTLPHLMLAACICAAGSLAPALKPTPAAAQPVTRSAPADPLPLFTEHTRLELTLIADFRQLARDRSETTPERPALLRLTAADGSTKDIPLEVRTRGFFRLRRSTCSFPNLRLDFDRSPAALSTPFAGQNALKLVAHCRDSDAYEQNLLEEYLAYRLYNLLTEESLRVRLARITYRDVNGRAPPITRLAFFIEDIDDLAERLGGIQVEAPGARPEELESRASARVELFEYMIGNTDFSIVNFHNSEVVRLPDGTYHPVPYDFDFSGLVDAPYASPSIVLGTTSVRERVYRGFCRPGLDLQTLFAEFPTLRPVIERTLREQAELHPRNAERAVAYLDEFFETIESPRARHVLIEARCRRGIDKW